jgi:hypothetical protein
MLFFSPSWRTSLRQLLKKPGVAIRKAEVHRTPQIKTASLVRDAVFVKAVEPNNQTFI